MRTAPTRVNGIADYQRMRDARLPPRRLLRYVLRGDIFRHEEFSSIYELTQLGPYLVPYMVDSRLSLNPTAVGYEVSIWGSPRWTGLMLGLGLDSSQVYFEALVMELMDTALAIVMFGLIPFGKLAGCRGTLLVY